MKKILLAMSLMLAVVQCSSGAKEEVFPVNIKASVKVTKVEKTGGVEIAIRILNTSDAPQRIGTQICGVPKLVNWITNNKFVHVGGQGCRMNLAPDRPIVLNPGEVYEETCGVGFKWKIKSGLVTFRLGLQPAGYSAAWSNPVTIEVLPIIKRTAPYNLT